ncbi:TPA: hypothetical protein LLB39_002269 [Enterococcus faecium]|uniref:hypothetical protein n=1 Tax=Enterococcus faecium TaxID=1352 RepID=UPI001A25EBC7|nr:hypothetical protein [Enterococcus faecium]EKZ0022944.1 hypothetical protein [Enterococcus faecium]EKZ0025888.1 hypothetical protein [Enterococcus faecium]EKZ0061181.1 hypothetical protein [Enterococcus faecium]ELI7226652.1 hypothetical protein [Enterococcus faecium]MBJ1151353.1 hypothetical protein [Enterococcus faecium]
MTDKTSDLPKLAPKISQVKRKKDGKTKNAVKKKSGKETSSLLLDIPMSSFDEILDDNTDETSDKIASHIGMNSQNDSFYNLLNSLRELEDKKNQVIASKAPDLTTDLDAEIIQIKQDERSVKSLLKTYFDGFDKELAPYSQAILTKPIQAPHISISLQKKSDD